MKVTLEEFGRRIGVPSAKLKPVSAFERTEENGTTFVLLNSERTVSYLKNRTEKGNVSEDAKRLAAILLSEINGTDVVFATSNPKPTISIAADKTPNPNDEPPTIAAPVSPIVTECPALPDSQTAIEPTQATPKPQHWALYALEVMALLVLLSASTYISAQDATRFRPDMSALSRTAMVMVLELVGLMVLYYNAKAGNGTSETKVLRLYTLFWILPCSLQYWIDGVEFDLWETNPRFVLEGTLFAVLASSVFSFGHYYVSKVVSSWF